MTYLLLAGFPGTDAPAVGRVLAARLRLPFQEAMTLDAEGLAALVKDETSAVVAVDGALLTTPDNLDLARRAGPLVWLIAGAKPSPRRAGVRTGQRPEQKVAEPLAKMREILESRQTVIPHGDIELDTTTLEPGEAVEQVLDWLNQVRVHLGERSYDIQIAEGCHADVGPFLARLPERVSSVVLISHRPVYRHYGDALRAGIEAAGLTCHSLPVPAGERYKSLQTAGRLYGDLIQRKVDRKAVIVALGGGVIGDLAGFVAATYERGIRFAQVPTTLLAQVDSSVGGKVGVNHPLGKNMIGAFLQPQGVFIDPRTLDTLALRELRSGIAEVVKYGVIADSDFFGFLESHVDEILRRDPLAITHIIRRSCQIKARVVEQDEREANLRAILNYGHTTAHAVETYTAYERYTHGEAVGVGMVVAARIAHALGMLKAEPVHRITRLLERFGLPTHLPKADPGVLMSLMDTDKKAVAGQVRFVLPTRIGDVQLVDNVPKDVLRRAIKESLEL